MRKRVEAEEEFTEFVRVPKAVCIKGSGTVVSVNLIDVQDRDRRNMIQIGGVRNVQSAGRGMRFQTDIAHMAALRTFCEGSGIVLYADGILPGDHREDPESGPGKPVGRFTRCGSGWDFRFS